MWQRFKNLFKKKKENPEEPKHYIVVFHDDHRVIGLELNQEEYSDFVNKWRDKLCGDAGHYTDHTIYGWAFPLELANDNHIPRLSYRGDVSYFRNWVEVKNKNNLASLLYEIKRKKEQEMQKINYTEKNNKVFKEGTVVKLEAKDTDNQGSFLALIYSFRKDDGTYYKIALIGEACEFYEFRAAKDKIGRLTSKSLKELYDAISYYYKIKIPSVVNIEAEF